MTNIIETNLDRDDRGGQKEVVTNKRCVECNAITAALFFYEMEPTFSCSISHTYFKSEKTIHRGP